MGELDVLESVLKSLPSSFLGDIGTKITFMKQPHYLLATGYTQMTDTRAHIYESGSSEDIKLRDGYLRIALIHELLHVKDMYGYTHRGTQLYGYSGGDEFLDRVRSVLRSDQNKEVFYRMKDPYNKSYQYEWYVLSNQSVARLDILDKRYNCSLYYVHEFFACAGTMYVTDPAKLKHDFPTLYDYYKTRVFGGREY